MPPVARCRIRLGSEEMEEVWEFQCLGTVLCKHGGMEGEIRERVMKGRSVNCGFAHWGNQMLLDEECVYGRKEGSEE